MKKSFSTGLVILILISQAVGRGHGGHGGHGSHGSHGSFHGFGRSHSISSHSSSSGHSGSSGHSESSGHSSYSGYHPRYYGSGRHRSSNSSAISIISYKPSYLIATSLACILWTL
ncbi:keratin-associated protein 19-2-like [Microplitis mediator]|uniref:keratin-associated protein 19-2-like n=1 Tax=Microplitis mediator TaxID=375433 RepID=UPI002552B0F4|nr:keratin-associated protein 19-2-like [Microplitis mediator]